MISSQDSQKGVLLTIIRGLPGSGKSTKAIELYKQGAGLLIEPDACLNVDGVYTYTPGRMDIVRASLEGALFELSLERFWKRTQVETVSIPIIYVDCLPKIDDVFSLITNIGYKYATDRVNVIDCLVTKEQSIKHNIHNVRIEDIQRMDKEWEPWSIVQEHGYKYQDIVIPPNSFIVEESRYKY